MGLHVFFVAVFLIQSIAAPATWAGDEDAPAQNPTPQDATPTLPVNVSDGRGRLSGFDRLAAEDLAKRITETTPGSFSTADRLQIQVAIEKIAASLPTITDRGTYEVIMTNRRAALLHEINRFISLQESLSGEMAGTPVTAATSTGDCSDIHR